MNSRRAALGSAETIPIRQAGRGMARVRTMIKEEPLVVGLGERRYRVERPWGELPPGLTYGTVSKLAVDRRGRVYVFQRGDPPLITFESSGAFRSAWGQGLIADAHGIYITPDDRVLLVDRDARKALRAAHRSLVAGSIKYGGDTFGKIRKALDLTDNEIRTALRGLIRTGRIEKASARRYAIKGD